MRRNLHVPQDRVKILSMHQNASTEVKDEMWIDQGNAEKAENTSLEQTSNIGHYFGIARLKSTA